MNREASREAFEAFVLEWDYYSDDLARWANGEYRSEITQLAWEVWQAATQAALEAAREICLAKAKEWHGEDEFWDYAAQICADEIRKILEETK